MEAAVVAALKEQVARIAPEVADLRRDLHRIPEVNPHEHATRARLVEALDGLPIAWHAPYLGTDLVGDLEVGAARTIALRADIDALPIAEIADCPWASQHEGVMHACGHDGHAAILVGAARVLGALRDQLAVNVRFVFQPGEESVCQGKELVARGAVDGCVAAYALHGWPGLPLGTIASRPGPFFAAGDFYTLTVRGRGGHAGIPARTRNPLVAGAHAIVALDKLHERVHAEDGSVVAICSAHGGTANNIVPAEFVVEGTVRYLQPGRGTALAAAMREAVAPTGDRPGIDVDLDYRALYDLPVVNDPAAVTRLRKIVAEVLPGAWQQCPTATMTSEDFAFYLRDRPGVMFWLGLGQECAGLHTPSFDFADAAISPGITIMAALALAGDESPTGAPAGAS